MRKNKVYESLIDKSLGSMLSAIEIYNKPDFKYREETFAILAVNSWELLLKARLLKINNFRNNSIYCYKPYMNKNGEKSKKKKVLDRNRSNNPKTISIITALQRLEEGNELPPNLKDNIDALIEFRDNAVHFINESNFSKPLQELGFATIKNYVYIFKQWKINRKLSNYNLYLMPLAYIDDKLDIDAISTNEEQNFMNLLRTIIKGGKRNVDCDITIKIELKFQKGNSFDTAGVHYDSNGFPVKLTEEDFRNRYPLTYSDVVDKSRNRYTDFKQGKIFNGIMRNVKNNYKLYYERKLDTNNPKSQKKGFYSNNIWQELDKYYSRNPF